VEGFDQKELDFAIRHAIKLIDGVKGSEDDVRLGLLKDILQDKDFKGIKLYNVKEEDFWPPLKVYKFAKTSKYDNGTIKEDISISLTHDLSSVQFYYLKQLSTHAIREQDEEEKTGFLGKLFGKKKEAQEPRRLNLFNPNEDRYRKIYMNMRKGVEPGLEINYTTNKGEQNSRLYQLNKDGTRELIENGQPQRF